MSISFESSGSFDSTEALLRSIVNGDIFRTLSRFGEAGVAALAAATPKDSGETASSWYYEIKEDGKSWSIIWGNSHMVDGQIIAVLLEHGHGTRNGGYVQGREYMNGAMQPIFDQMAEEAWKAVRSR